MDQIEAFKYELKLRNKQILKTEDLHKNILGIIEGALASADGQMAILTINEN